MADSGTERFLSDLELSFEAELAREDHAAATDLALSLLQDESLPGAVAQGAAAVRVDGQRVAVSEVGPDYVAAGPPDVLVPLRHAVVEVRPDRRGAPVRTRGDLLTRLRRLVRDGASVIVVTREGSRYGGRLAAAARDHLRVVEDERTTLIPLAQIHHVKIRSGG